MTEDQLRDISELHKHNLRLDVSTIGDFQIQKKAQKEGKNARKAEKVRVDVLCTVRFSIPSPVFFAAGWFASYLGLVRL